MKFIGKILPVEGYYVLLDNELTIDYAQSLTHLYQPLIGIKAVSLYQTLLHDIELQSNSSLQTHHTLMIYLNLSLDEIYKARLKLEGIGLLKTYEQTSIENKSYLYRLQSPFSPKNFFKDAMLTELLYYHLGKNKYKILKNHYEEASNKQSGYNITATFSEVFQTIQPHKAHVEEIKINKAEQQGPNIKEVDFSSIELMLSQRMIPKNKVMTSKNKRLISEMMHLYDLAAYEIEKSILWALNEENILDVDEFKNACHDLFKVKHNESPLTLATKQQSENKPEVDFSSLTKEEQLIHQFETISPKQILEDLSSGNQASEREMRMISEVMTSQGLPAPVMNVLVHYVLIQSDMKLSKAYLETIASHWSRANLKTAKEAMEFARKEIENFQKGKKSNRRFRRRASKEVIPEWFKDRDKKQPTQSTSPESEAERKELAALLQQMAGSEQK